MEKSHPELKTKTSSLLCLIAVTERTNMWGEGARRILQQLGLVVLGLKGNM
jgi:hypothetical protein